MTKDKQITDSQQPEQTTDPILDDGQAEIITPFPEQLATEQTTATTIPKQSVSSRYYTPDEFYQVFKSFFQYGGDMLHIESLPIKENEEAGARVTSNRIYEMAEKYAFLRFMIDRTSTRIGETILMIQFLTLKASNVWHEKTKTSLSGVLWRKFKGYKQQKMTVNATAYSAQAAAEKQQKQDNLSANQNA